MSGVLVLTCASGQQGAHIIPLLYGKPNSPFHLRLVVNSESSVARLSEQYPKAEVVQADLVNIADCHRIGKGVSTVYHIGPSMHPRESDVGINMVDAAMAESKREDSTFKHFVFSSVLNSQLSKMLNHDRKRYVEEHLMESDLSWTILQPCHFADQSLGMLVGQLDQDKPVYLALYDPTIPFSFLALRDLGEASSRVIMEREKHYFAVYPLTSTGPMPYTEFVRIVGSEMGKDVSVERLPYETAVDKMCNGLLKSKSADQGYRDGPERMLLFYNKRGLIGSPNVLQWLLGRQPTSISQLARIEINAASRKPTR